MHLLQVLALALPAAANLLDDASQLIARQVVNQDYLNSVCSPNITNPTTIPPCISINTIETICKPNGTSGAAYAASAQCLCNRPSSFFADWLGCRKCLQVHGGLSEREYNAYSIRLNVVSSSICSATPTAAFAAIFESAAVTQVATGATTSSDQFPSQTAVSLYYTASGSQGPGSYAGASGSGSSTRSSGSNTLTSGSSAATGSSGASATSRSEAKVTIAPLKPLALAIAGGMAIAVL